MNKSDRQRFDDLERLVKTNTTILSKIETFLTTGQVRANPEELTPAECARADGIANKILADLHRKKRRKSNPPTTDQAN